MTHEQVKKLQDLIWNHKGVVNVDIVSYPDKRGYDLRLYKRYNDEVIHIHIEDTHDYAKDSK